MNTGLESKRHSPRAGASFLLADEKLTLDPNQSLHLYLLVSGSEITAVLFSPKRNNFLALATAGGGSSHPEKLTEFLEETRMLSMGTVARSTVVACTQQTLLPAALYRPESSGEIMNFNFGEDSASAVHAQKIRCIDAQMIFRIPSSWTSACQEVLPAPAFVHHLSGVVENFFLQHKNRNETEALLHLREGFADILVKRGRTLLLLNSYTCHTPEDTLYHTLNVYEQLQLNPEKDALELAGAVEKDDAAHALLARYFRQPAFSARPAVAGYSYVFDTIPSHRHYSLFSQLLCES